MRDPFTLRLKAGLVFGGAIIFILGVVLMARHAHHQVEDALVEQTKQQLLMIAKATATSLARHLGGHLNSLSEIAHDPLFAKEQVAISGDGPELERLRIFYRAHRRELASITLFDAAGTPLLSLPEETGRQVHLADEFDLASFTTELVPQVNPHALDASGRSKAVALAVPIAAEGKLVGIVQAQVSIDTLISLYIQPIKLGAGGMPVLIDEHGHFLSPPPPPPASKAAAAPSDCDRKKCSNRQVIREEIAAGRDGVGIFMADHPGAPPQARFVAYAPVKFQAKNWGIGVALPYSAISGPIKHHSRQALGMVAAVLFFFGLAASLLFRMQKRKQSLEIEALYLQEIAEKATELERVNLVLKEQAVKDELTGLYNYRYFHKVLQRDFALAARGKGDYSCMLIDLDHFKQVNDSHGHAFGDSVLKGVGRILTEESRDTDVVARYGGEEFVILLPDTDLAGSKIIAERIRARMEAHVHTEGTHRRQVTASIGVSSFRAHSPQSPQDLLAYADKALYQAKATQRNRVVVYE